MSEPAPPDALPSSPMAAEVIDGKAVAALVRAEVKREVSELVAETGRTPGLATVLVGDDPASAVYVAGKRRACAEVGIADLHQHLADGVPEAQVAALLEELGADPEVSGILLQLPVPDYMDGAALTATIVPDKDVDGLTLINAGRLAQGVPGLRPCTPLGIIELLDTYQVELEGAEAVVVGRSNLVGKPVSAMLLERNATVTHCHSRTRDLAGVCRRGDILVAAVGVPGLIGAEHVKEGAVVIDVGISRTEAGLRGDVDFDAASERARLITPVPGGVGPMTIAMLLRNTLSAFRLQGLPRAPVTR
ncbi:MAG: methylenetetrahydrofolate dehydrogenase / methenyltetrahydrofolate cyclohydrolase [Solirubrobacteraceae bacterium]|jgi:methylenetetrahydrofolate dehydrogenase (NADP+)/methenyltetrahydrofolate cyclohydrolase|nr:methylenetetrahydrofolate dehydrogenase / methenyltetrahydrofolate cyclohydrolase [Solirubrobacteraceae bacterium]